MAFILLRKFTNGRYRNVELNILSKKQAAVEFEIPKLSDSMLLRTYQPSLAAFAICVVGK